LEESSRPFLWAVDRLQAAPFAFDIEYQRPRGDMSAGGIKDRRQFLEAWH